MTLRLPPHDVAFLDDANITYRTFDDASGMLNVELVDFKLPEGLSCRKANILFRLPSTYPDTAPDMWWAVPAIHKPGGGVIAATEMTETFDGRTWQRWSRHLDGGTWRSGIDGLKAYVRLLRSELIAAAA